MNGNYWRDRVVLVTGGTSGLGLMIANAFADAGARIVVAGLEQETVDRTIESFESRSVDVLGVRADITRQEQVDALFEKAVSHFGRLDCLVNNAGRSMRGPLKETTPEQFQKLIDLNVIAMIRCTLAALPHLIERRGHVVNIGSLAAKSAARYTGAYPTSKHAVAAYSQQLRLEHAEDGLHVLLVCPGPIRRDDDRLYALEGSDKTPEHAREPGAGVKLKGIDPDWLAARIVRYCEKRKPEIVAPLKARILFAIAQLNPSLGDWIVRKMT